VKKDIQKRETAEWTQIHRYMWNAYRKMEVYGKDFVIGQPILVEMSVDNHHYVLVCCVCKKQSKAVTLHHAGTKGRGGIAPTHFLPLHFFLWR
jgi:hypothetical protein